MSLTDKLAESGFLDSLDLFVNVDPSTVMYRLSWI